MTILPSIQYPARTEEEIQNNWVVRLTALAQARQNGIQIHRLIGDPGSKTAELEGIIKEPHKFGLERIEALPGQGPAPMQHDYVVVLFSFSGKWRVYWGNEPGTVEGETKLERWDLFSIPSGVWFGFENAGEEEGAMLLVREDH